MGFTYLSPLHEVDKKAFCDLSHIYRKHVTNVSPACFCNPTVGDFDVSPNNSQWHPIFRKFIGACNTFSVPG